MHMEKTSDINYVWSQPIYYPCIIQAYSTSGASPYEHVCDVTPSAVLPFAMH